MVTDSSGAMVACGGGGSAGTGPNPGLGGFLAISCPEFLIPSPNRVDVDGQIGQLPQTLSVSNIFVIIAGVGAGTGTAQVAVSGNGGPPLMYGAGAGGAGGQNGSNGYVLISW